MSNGNVGGRSSNFFIPKDLGALNAAYKRWVEQTKLCEILWHNLWYMPSRETCVAVAQGKKLEKELAEKYMELGGRLASPRNS